MYQSVPLICVFCILSAFHQRYSQEQYDYTSIIFLSCDTQNNYDFMVLTPKREGVLFCCNIYCQIIAAK